MTTSPEKIIIDPRIYDISRRISIRGVMDAIVELVTNSFDAYRSISTKGVVDIFTSSESERLITVVDTAVGVNGDDFYSKVLTAGSLTSKLTSRGMMGRGLKDISAIGDLVIRTVNNGRYSRAEIGSDLTVKGVILNATPPDDLWSKLGVEDRKSFFHVTVKVLKEIEWLSNPILKSRIRDIVFLRGEKENTVRFNNEKLSFKLSNDAGKLLSSFTIKIPRYESDDVSSHAKLTIHKYNSNLAARCREAHPHLSHDRKDYFYHGIEVSSGNTVYEISDCSDGSWNATGYASYKFIHGTLDAPMIHKLARELFEKGATEKNPFLIFDPNRREGLNRRHPYIKELFSQVGKWIRHVLRSISKSEDDAIEESDFLKNVLDTLKDSIQQSIELTDVKVYTWRSKKTHEDLKEFVDYVDSIDHIDESINDDDSNSIIPSNPPPPVMEETSALAKPNINFQLVTDADMDYIYTIKYEGENITVYLNSLDPALSTYIKFETETQQPVSAVDIISSSATEEGIIKTKATIEPTEPAYVMMGMIVREAITEIQTRNILLMGAKSTTTDDMNSINEVKKEAYETFKPQVESLFRQIHTPKTHSAAVQPVSPQV